MERPWVKIKFVLLKGMPPPKTTYKYVDEKQMDDLKDELVEAIEIVKEAKESLKEARASLRAAKSSVTKAKTPVEREKAKLLVQYNEDDVQDAVVALEDAQQGVKNLRAEIADLREFQKQARGRTSSPKKTPCPPGKIRNPASGRCVNRDGKIGKTL